jgi:cell division protein FtsW (lipid II flippase)
MYLACARLGLAAQVAVDVFDAVGMGAQRWSRWAWCVQPSEFLKLALVRSSHAYFNGLRKPSPFAGATSDRSCSRR